MAKVKAALGDVKTAFEPAPPGRYKLKIAEIKEKTEQADPPFQHMERQNFNFKIAIDDGGEHQGKAIYHNCALNKKNGEPNNAGLADLKRFFMGCLGYDEDDPFFQDQNNLDTDLILNKNFEGDVIIGSYTPQGQTTARQRNELVMYSVTPVQG